MSLASHAGVYALLNRPPLSQVIESMHQSP